MIKSEKRDQNEGGLHPKTAIMMSKSARTPGISLFAMILSCTGEEGHYFGQLSTREHSFKQLFLSGKVTVDFSNFLLRL